MARSAEELSELTEEERAALEEADTEEAGMESEAAEAAAAADKAETDAASDDEDDDGEPDAAEAKAKADADAAAEAVKAEEPKTDPKTEPQKAREPAEDIDAKIAALDTKLGEVADRFDEGEMTARELLTEQQKLNDERTTLKMQQEMARSRHEDSVAKWSDSIVPAFFDAHKEYAGNKTLYGMLNTEVIQRQEAAIEAGGDPFAPSILTEADAALKAAVKALSGEPADAAEADPEPTKTAKDKPTRPDMPPTLANVPAADINNTDGGKLAYLDRLAAKDAVAFEDAFAKLPEADREAYLAQQ